MAERRRLPVLNSPAPAPDAPEEEEVRPPWHWVGFGTVAIFAFWLPLAYVAAGLARQVMEARFGKDASKEMIDLALVAMSSAERTRILATIALPSILGLMIAAFAGGVIVGRFGSGTGPREAAWSGALTAVIASVMAWSGFTGATVISIAVTLVASTGFAAWGGRLGASRRRLGQKP